MIKVLSLVIQYFFKTESSQPIMFILEQYTEVF